MENLTIIIPIHKLDDNARHYLSRAIDSVTSQNIPLTQISIVGDTSTTNQLSEIGTNLIVNDGSTDYCSQINLATKTIKTKYFSILAFDDVYSPTWFKNVENYINHMPEYSMFLPIVTYINKDGEHVGMVNEIIWAMSFSNEIGVIDSDTLQSYYDFSVNGGVFRTDDFIEVGGLKPSIKLSFWYEYLLRATNQGSKVYVIPRNGYYQEIDREDSMNTLQNMDEAERTWWIKLASKEYYFKQERKKEYEYVPEKELEEVEGL